MRNGATWILDFRFRLCNYELTRRFTKKESTFRYELMGGPKKELWAKSYRRLHLGHATGPIELLKLLFLVHFLASNSFKLIEGEQL